MLIFFKVRSKDVRKALDDAAQKRALFGTIVLFVVLFACIVYFMLHPTSYVSNLHFIVLAVIAAILFYIRSMSKAIIEAVYRGKSGKNAELYNKHRIYFDKKFVSIERKEKSKDSSHTNSD